MPLHSGICKQLGQVAEATRNQEKVVGEMSHQLEVPPAEENMDWIIVSGWNGSAAKPFWGWEENGRS